MTKRLARHRASVPQAGLTVISMGVLPTWEWRLVFGTSPRHRALDHIQVPGFTFYRHFTKRNHFDTHFCIILERNQINQMRVQAAPGLVGETGWPM